MAKKRRKKPTVADPDDDAPGWHAIDARCEELYPGQTEPKHYAAIPHPPFGDGLIYGISAYEAEAPTRHWHFVTYGFSELYAKETDDPAVSGWGFELTFRLARAGEDEPPAWAVNFLMNLGRYVRRSGNPFAAGHHMDLNGPIALSADTAIRGIAFATDPGLGAIETPNGRVEFLQIVGVTSDELDACGDWHTGGVLDVLRGTNPVLVTDLARRSMLEAHDRAALVQAGIDRDGSQSGRMYVAVVDWKQSKKKAKVTLGAKGVGGLVGKLRSRLGHGRDFWLVSREKMVGFRPGPAVGWEEDDSGLVLTLTPDALAAVRAGLKPVRGEYTWAEFPGLTIEVRPSEITDATGKVIRVIG